MKHIRIIQEPTPQKPFLVIYKPKNLPSAPIAGTNSDNALDQAIKLFPQIKTVKGVKDIEYGLLHRLDTPTDGLLLIATEQNFYDYMRCLQKENLFIKQYTALCNKLCVKDFLEGFPCNPPPVNNNQIKVTSFFRPYGPGNSEVRPVTLSSGKAALKKIGQKKEYSTKVSVLSDLEKEENVLVTCTINQGFRHQVRSHLAWAGLPIIGDNLYNPKYLNKKNAEEPLRFSATKLIFEYPKGDLNSYEITFTWT